jgi:leader peptidase (prepilin peptidase)/N-methyltransferase
VSTASTATAMGVAVACGLVASIPLARLTLTVPDRAERRWYRGRPAGAGRVLVTALIAAAFAGLAGAASGWSAALPAWIALALVLAPLAVIDVEHHRLPDRLIAVGYLAAVALLGLAAVSTGAESRLARAGVAAIATAVAFGLPVLLAPASMGLGDVKLAGLLGGYLGWLGWDRLVDGILAGFVIGAAVALALVATRRAGLRTAFAFGPALMSGALLVAALG